MRVYRDESSLLCTVLAMDSGFLIFAAAWLGGCTASFLGVVADRGWRGSMVGRSLCVCGTQIPFWWNIPVLSWLALRGRASCCKAVIPSRYVLTELAMATTGGLCALDGPYSAAVGLLISGAVVLRVSRTSS